MQHKNTQAIGVCLNSPSFTATVTVTGIFAYSSVSLIIRRQLVSRLRWFPYVILIIGQDGCDRETRLYQCLLHSKSTQRCLGDVAIIFKAWFLNSSLYRIVAWTHAVKLPSGKKHMISLMISRHWFRLWLGAIRPQAITWADVDPHLLPLASLGHNELKYFSRTSPVTRCFCMWPANERWRYNLTSSLNGWAHSQNDSRLVPGNSLEKVIYHSIF